MLGFKDFRCARIILGGIEVMHMIVKGQMKCRKGISSSPARQSYSLGRVHIFTNGRTRTGKRSKDEIAVSQLVRPS